MPRPCWLEVCTLVARLQRISSARAAELAERFLQLVRAGATRHSDVIAALVTPLAFGNGVRAVAVARELAELGLLQNAVVRNALVAALARCGEAGSAVELVRAHLPADERLDAEATAALILALERFAAWDAVDLLVCSWRPTPPHVVMSAVVRSLVHHNQLTAAVEVYGVMLRLHGACLDAFHDIVFSAYNKTHCRHVLMLLLIDEHRSRGVYLSPAVLIAERHLARRSVEPVRRSNLGVRGQALRVELSLHTQHVEQRRAWRDRLAGVGRSAGVDKGHHGAVGVDEDQHDAEDDAAVNEPDNELQLTPDQLVDVGKMALADTRLSNDVVTETLLTQHALLTAAVAEGRADAIELPALFLEASFQLVAIDLMSEALTALKLMRSVGMLPRPSDVEPLFEQLTAWDQAYALPDYHNKVTERFKMFRTVLDMMGAWSVPPPPMAFPMLLRFGVRTRRFSSMVSVIDSMRDSFAPLPAIVLWRVLHRATCEDNFSLAAQRVSPAPISHHNVAMYLSQRNEHIREVITKRLPGGAECESAELERDLPTALLRLLHRAGDESVLPALADYVAHLRHQVAMLALCEFRWSWWTCRKCHRRNWRGACSKCGRTLAQVLADMHAESVKRAHESISHHTRARFPLLPPLEERAKRLALIDETLAAMRERGLKLSEQHADTLLREYVLQYVRSVQQKRLGSQFKNPDEIYSAVPPPPPPSGGVAELLLPPLALMRNQFGHISLFDELEQRFKR